MVHFASFIVVKHLPSSIGLVVILKMDSKSSTLQPPYRRNLRRSSSLEEDSEEVRKKFQQLRGGLDVAPGQTGAVEEQNFKLSETAPNAAYFYQQKVARSTTTMRVHYPQSQPAGLAVAKYIHTSSNSLHCSPEKEKKISANLDNAIVQCSLCYNDYSEDNPKLVPRNLSCGHTYCTGEGVAVVCCCFAAVQHVENLSVHESTCGECYCAIKFYLVQ